jgi:uncharacterized membrane protein
MSSLEDEALGARSRDFGGRSLGPEGRGGASRTWRGRGAVAISLLAIDLAVLVMTVAEIHGTVRFVLGIILGTVIPGWSVVGLLRLGNLALEVGLAMAVGLAVMLLAAQILITLQEWHPIAFEEIVCAVCIPSLVWQSIPRTGRRSPRSG